MLTFIFFVTAIFFGGVMYLAMRAWKAGNKALARFMVTTLVCGYVIFALFVLQVYGVL